MDFPREMMRVYTSPAHNVRVSTEMPLHRSKSEACGLHLKSAIRLFLLRPLRCVVLLCLVAQRFFQQHSSVEKNDRRPRKIRPLDSVCSPTIPFDATTEIREETT